MKKVELRKDDLIELFPDSVKKMKVRLLGLRGLELSEGKPTINSLDLCEDLMIVYTHGELQAFRCCTDPSQLLIKSGESAKGCFRLRPGGWWLKPAMVGTNQPGLIQASDVIYERLGRFGKPLVVDHGQINMAIVSSGIPPYIAAGKQLIYSPDQSWGRSWKMFWDTVMRAYKKTSQKNIPYFLIDVRETPVKGVTITETAEPTPVPVAPTLKRKQRHIRVSIPNTKRG